MHRRTVHPLFPKLVPLAEEWYDLMRETRMKVKFDEAISLFDKHINALPDEEDELSKKAKRLGDGKDDVTLALSK
jgi:hypothetical protein